MQLGIFDEEKRLKRLSELGDSLERLKNVINWEMFRRILEIALNRSGTGRPAYDSILMFKILILQRIYNLSDDQTEYQINDRMSFMRFLGLGLESKVPDAKIIWLFRETLTKAGVIRELFYQFNKQLKDAHIITRKGSIVDATFVEAPKQRNSREENKEIKSGKVPEEWQDATDPKKVHKLRQKDTDARWTKKGNNSYYGYKDHIKADAESKVITKYEVTAANVHDSQMLAELVDEKDEVVYGDSAYNAKEIIEELPENVEVRFNEKGCKNRQLTDEQKANNRAKSKVRSRIEHIFGFMTGAMHGITVRSKE